MSVRAEPGAQSLLSIVQDQIVMTPAERREAVLHVIRSARRRLVLSLFRCNDFDILNGLAEAVRRKVRVEVMLTRRAKGSQKWLKELAALLKSMHVKVRRYPDRGIKYHAKYVVADERLALVASLNFTRKCFEKTCDFILVTRDPRVVHGLQRLFDADRGKQEADAVDGFGERLILGPEGARSRIIGLLKQARRSIRILDHKLDDPEILALLKRRQAEGVTVEVLGPVLAGGLRPHGKMLLLDDEAAVIGSVSLSPIHMDHRREIAVIIREPHAVAQMRKYFHSLSALKPNTISPNVVGTILTINLAGCTSQ